MASAKAKKVVVIGAGLAGLISSLTLQKAGYSVVLLDKRSQVGGLCGTFSMDGYEFVIACNDFGAGLQKLLKKLGVEQKFEHKKSAIYYAGNWVNAEPGFRMLWQLRHDWKNFFALMGGIIAQQLPSRKPQTIESFVDRHTTKGAVNDLAKIIAYFMGVAPYDIHTSYFGLDSQYGYGYTKMVCPIGGPQVLSSTIAQTFLAQGGKLLLETRYHQHQKTENGYHVELINQQQRLHMRADYLVDTSERNSLYQPDTKRGLPLSMMCLAVDEDYIYPAGMHTLSYYEPNVSEWFKILDEGTQPQNFGFHIFKSDICDTPQVPLENFYSDPFVRKAETERGKAKAGKTTIEKASTTEYEVREAALCDYCCATVATQPIEAALQNTARKSAYTINVYFYLPRGVQQLDNAQRDFYRTYLLERIEKMLPGIGAHIQYSRILAPEDFEKMHGLSSRVMPFITNLEKPQNGTNDTDFFYAGHTVFPPGEHAGAAALSGHLVAKSIIST